MPEGFFELVIQIGMVYSCTLKKKKKKKKEEKTNEFDSKWNGIEIEFCTDTFPIDVMIHAWHLIKIFQFSVLQLQITFRTKRISRCESHFVKKKKKKKNSLALKYFRSRLCHVYTHVLFIESYDLKFRPRWFYPPRVKRQCGALKTRKWVANLMTTW